MTTLRILGSKGPQSRAAPVQSLAELHTILESSVERLSSGISFRSLHSSAARSADAVEQRTVNSDLIRAAENAQHSMAVQESTVALIDRLNEDLTTLYGICQKDTDPKGNALFASTLERIRSHTRPDSKIISIFGEDEYFTPELQWNQEALQLDLNQPKEKILSGISEAISLLAYAKTRAETGIGHSKMLMAKLLVSRENKSAAQCATTGKMKLLKEVYDE